MCVPRSANVSSGVEGCPCGRSRQAGLGVGRRPHGGMRMPSQAWVVRAGSRGEHEQYNIESSRSTIDWAEVATSGPISPRTRSRRCWLRSTPVPRTGGHRQILIGDKTTSRPAWICCARPAEASLPGQGPASSSRYARSSSRSKTPSRASSTWKPTVAALWPGSAPASPNACWR